MAERGQLSARRGVIPKYPETDVEKIGVRLLLLSPGDAEKLGKKYFELRERFLINRR